jgi:hypothetical protein
MNQEDPVISMARRLLFGNNSPRWNNGHVMVGCYSCGRRMMTKGMRQQWIDGKKRYICPDCYELKYTE